MAEYWRALKYPLLVWLVTDSVFTLLGYLVPSFATINDAGVTTIIEALPLGAIAGYKMIQLKGNLFHVLVVGIITGLWCVFLGVTEVGMVLSPFGTYNFFDQWVYTYPFFTADMIGAIIGAGFAVTRKM